MRKLKFLHLLHFLHLTVKFLLKSLLNAIGFYILYQNNSNEKKELQESRQNDALLYNDDASSMVIIFCDSLTCSTSLNAIGLLLNAVG